MKILGIESSCDETAAAVVEDGVKVLSNVIASQIELHRKTGGVVPEVAAREHVVKIMPVIDEALRSAGVTMAEIDAIAITAGPGLLSSLVIGLTAAKTLACVYKKPLIAVNHIAGHIYGNWLQLKAGETIEFPCVVLTVSGGHNELVYMKQHAHFELIGETLDDAAGEAFDKVARLLGLGYPGGPEISKIALKGDAKVIRFPRAYLGDSFDFSFSGLKTSVWQYVRKEHVRAGKLSKKFVADCAAAFQESVCEILADKFLHAAEQFKVKQILLSGGVSANLRLREVIGERLAEGYFLDKKGRKCALSLHPQFRFPAQISFCTDNAAMIAAAGYFKFVAGAQKTTRAGSLMADPNLALGED